jgi:Bacterial RNA polymerase, alpha chain C terminal domain
MFDPAPNLPDDTLIEIVRFSPLIRKSLNAAGLKTIGEIRAMSDDKLRRMRGVGTGSFAYLRKTIGTGLKAKGKT